MADLQQWRTELDEMPTELTDSELLRAVALYTRSMDYRLATIEKVLNFIGAMVLLGTIVALLVVLGVITLDVHVAV
jgi:hypothetical protein